MLFFYSNKLKCDARKPVVLMKRFFPMVRMTFAFTVCDTQPLSKKNTLKPSLINLSSCSTANASFRRRYGWRISSYYKVNYIKPLRKLTTSVQKRQSQTLESYLAISRDSSLRSEWRKHISSHFCLICYILSVERRSLRPKYINNIYKPE